MLCIIFILCVTRLVNKLLQYSTITNKISFSYLKALDQVTNGHTGGDGVGVDDDIGSQTLAGEDHIFLPGKKVLYSKKHMLENTMKLQRKVYTNMTRETRGKPFRQCKKS